MSNHRSLRLAPAATIAAILALAGTTHAGTFTVTSTADAGAGTLREAIDMANGAPGFDTICFNIAGAGPHTITLAAHLTSITDPVLIDGFTQPGSIPNSNPITMPINAVHMVIVHGNTGAFNAFQPNADGCRIRGLAIVQCIHAIQTGRDGGRFDGNFIDENSTGILIASGESNVIGTDGNAVDDPAERNLITRNTCGVRIVEGATENVVAGNFIGTDAAGTAARANAVGITINQGSFQNLIGTDGDGVADLEERNLISGSIEIGLEISGNGTLGNVVAGNLIGTDRTGATQIPNGLDGIRIRMEASENLVGTDGDGAGDAAERNVISGNDRHGVAITSNASANRVAGNVIGADITGLADLSNVETGVFISEGAETNVVGTNGDGAGDAAEGNLISGNNSNGVSIVLAGNGNVVAGNFIGTDVLGANALGNAGAGVSVAQSSIVRIGTNGDGVGDAEERNVISANGEQGVVLDGSIGSTVAGNFVGTDSTGQLELGNGFDGIGLQGDSRSNTIGTDGDGNGDAAEANVSSGNEGAGVKLLEDCDSNWIAGNRIGTDVDGVDSIPNDGPGILFFRTDRNRVGTDGDDQSVVEERNIISGNAAEGIRFLESPDNTIAGNFIGTDVSGQFALGNGLDGVALLGGSALNRVGTTGNGFGDAIEGNLISGNNGSGVYVEESDQVLVAGNHIGTDAAGLAPIPNTFHGVRLLGSSGTRIGTNGDGTSDVEERNLISGNALAGVSVIASLNTIIAGNFIGTDVMCETPLPNLGPGVDIGELSSTRVGLDHFGPGNPDDSNVIAFNGEAGVRVGPPNSPLASLNGINGNSIFGNGALGIDLLGGVEDAFGVTANDPNDPDPGPNGLQNFPVITSVDVFGNIQATLSTPMVAGSEYLIDFFASTAPDPSGHGEGETPIGRVNVITDGSGVTPIDVTLPLPPDKRFVTATATEFAGGAMQPNTSEFSMAFQAPTFCGLPGRPATDGTTDRVLRGYVIGWAVNQFGEEIKWNHLKGEGTIVNYRDAAAWEYNTFTHAVVSGVDHGAVTGTPGVLNLDGVEYSPSFAELLLNFQASGSDGFSSPPADGFTITSDTDLTLLPPAADLRQNSDGPVTTKASFTIWNENETKFSGTHRCITCWDQTLLSRYDTPNHFRYPFLQTDHGKARIEGEAADVCNVLDDPQTPEDESVTSIDAPLLGVAARWLTMNGIFGCRAAAGTNLVGLGVDDTAVIQYDAGDGGGPPESQEPGDPAAGARLDARTARQIESLIASVTGKGDGAPPAEALLGAPQDRVSGTEKGSLFFFSKVEIRWDANGTLVQDTFLSLTNDYPEDVRVQMYFINGDPPLLEDPDGLACFHPGWNRVDVGITLTANEPTYWSALTGLPKGVSPFTVLDP